MYWIIAAIFLLIALVVPRLRPIGVVGSVILILMLGWGMLARMLGKAPEVVPERGRPSAPTLAVQSFPLTELDSEELRIAGNGAPYELRGVIVNRSTTLRLRSFTAEVVRRDCFEGALDPSGCVVLWQSRQWVDASAAPGESREFASQFWTRGDVPRARGATRDDITIVAADGVPARPNAISSGG
ncbi:hypothetical protein [Povalibacter sp.]|uniref:hypothetical protein n=1 Tax=Povalibacter sp. TaxID=1962978 RepID=UPI002F40565B